MPAALARLADRGAAKAAFRTLARRVGGERVRLVVDPALGNEHLHVAVALLVGERALRRVHRQLVEIGRAQPRQLGVEVREQAPLEQRVVREVDARHQVRGAEGHLLGLGEEVVGPAVEHHPADHLQRHPLLGDQLGRVEVVEREGGGFLLGEQLHRQLPGGKCARGDRFEQVAAMEVGVGASDLHRLVPDRRLQSELGPPVELDEGRLAGRVEQAKAVHAEAFDHPQRPRQGAVGHDPHDHVHRLGRERDEVPEGVVRGRRLRKAAVRLHLHGVNQVGELDRVLDEEHRDVVADEIEVAFLRVQLDREAAHVARRVDRTGAAGHRREAGEDRRALADLGEDLRRGVVGERRSELEVTVGRAAPGMDDALGNPLVVEVGDLLAQDEVFEQRRPARMGAQRVLVVGDGQPWLVVSGGCAPPEV
jgi:hypothetical protein